MTASGRTFWTWIPRYVSVMQTRDFSKHTIEAYRRVLERFAKYEEYRLRNPETPLGSISDFRDCGLSAEVDVHHHEIEDFFGLIRDDCALSSASVRLYSSALSSFYRYLVKAGEVEANPMDKIDRPKARTRELKYLRHNEVMEFIESLKSRKNGVRDSLIARTIYATGMRISELCAMEVSYINFEEGTVKVPHGKGDKFRVVFCDTETLRLISEYLNGRQKGPVFLTSHGSGITPRMVQHIFNLHAPEGITPHKIRHSYASELYNRSHDIRAVQDNLGHTSIKTTEIYVHTNIAERQESYRKYFPLAEKR